MVAKNNKIHSKLALMFQEKTIHKTYLAIVKGRFSEEKKEGRLETYITRDIKDRKKMTVSKENGKKAISNYRVLDRKSTRLNSSHANISYAVFCLKKL